MFIFKLNKIYKPNVIEFIYLLLKPFLFHYKTISRLISPNNIVLEIGCGEGVFLNYLNNKSKSNNLTGIDINKNKINIAKRTSLYNKIQFINKDIFDFHITNIDIVIMSDFLHHISYEKQKKLITFIKKGLNKNGILIIKEIDRKFSFRYFLSYLSDHILYRDKIYFLKSKELINLLHKNNFKVIRKNLFNLFSTKLYICTLK